MKNFHLRTQSSPGLGLISDTSNTNWSLYTYVDKTNKGKYFENDWTALNNTMSQTILKSYL